MIDLKFHAALQVRIQVRDLRCCAGSLKRSMRLRIHVDSADKSLARRPIGPYLPRRRLSITFLYLSFSSPSSTAIQRQSRQNIALHLILPWNVLYFVWGVAIISPPMLVPYTYWSARSYSLECLHFARGHSVQWPRNSFLYKYWKVLWDKGSYSNTFISTSIVLLYLLANKVYVSFYN